MFTLSGKTKLRIPLYTLGALLVFSVLSCGVKNDPVPPESPVEMSRGRPNYKEDDGTELKSGKSQKKDAEQEEND